MSKTKKPKIEKVTKRVLVVQIVHYCCTECSEEEESVKMCKECGAPMKVVEVVEKYGAEAEEYLAKNGKELSEKDDVIVGANNTGAIAGEGVEDFGDIGDLDGGIEDDELDALGGALFGDQPENDSEEEDKALKRSTSKTNNAGSLLSDVLDEEDDETMDELFNEENVDGLPVL